MEYRMLDRAEQVFSGRKIKNIRIHKGYRLKEICELSNLTRNKVRRIENEEDPVDIDALVKLARALECTIKDFCVCGIELKMKSEYN